MYKIVYDIVASDGNGNTMRIPDYFLVFKTQDPSGDTVAQKEMYCRMSVARKGCTALSVKIVSEGYI